jgi:hypothetical protein
MLILGAASAVHAQSCSGMSLGNDASLNGFVPFPSTNAWNTNIYNATVDSNSAAIVSAGGFTGLATHVNFGSSSGDGGIPYVVVDSTQTPTVPIDVIAYADQSDVVVAPYPITAPIEGSPADCAGWPDTYIGDSHVLVLDRAKCWLYETYSTHRCSGQWTADSETIWDMTHYESRPWGWTSADAAGLSSPGWCVTTKSLPGRSTTPSALHCNTQRTTPMTAILLLPPRTPRALNGACRT